jgi:hypothetical protein
MDDEASFRPVSVILSLSAMLCDRSLLGAVGESLNFKSLTNVSSGNVVRKQPYEHPQHMNIVKPIICV